MASFVNPRDVSLHAGVAATGPQPLTEADLAVVGTFYTFDLAEAFDTLQTMLPLQSDGDNVTSMGDGTSTPAGKNHRKDRAEGVASEESAGESVRGPAAAADVPQLPSATLRVVPDTPHGESSTPGPAAYGFHSAPHTSGARVGAARRTGRRMDDVVPPPVPEPSALLPDDVVADDADDDGDDDEDGVATAGPDGKPLRYKLHGLRQLISDLVKAPKHRQWLTGRKGAFNRLTNKVLKPVWDQMCKFFPEHCKVEDVSARGVVQDQRRIKPASPIPPWEIEDVMAQNPGWNGVSVVEDIEDRPEVASNTSSAVTSPTAVSGSIKPSIATNTRAAARSSKWAGEDSPRSWGSESSTGPGAPMTFALGKTPSVAAAYAMPRESMPRGVMGGVASIRKASVSSTLPEIPSFSSMTRPGGWRAPSSAPFIVPQAHALTRPPTSSGYPQSVPFPPQRQEGSDDDLLSSDSDDDGVDSAKQSSARVDNLTTMTAKCCMCNQSQCSHVTGSKLSPPPTVHPLAPGKGIMSPPPLPPHRTVDFSSRQQVPIVTSDWLKAKPRGMLGGPFAQVPASAFAFPAAAPPVRPSAVPVPQRPVPLPPAADAFETSDGEMSVRSVQSGALDAMISELMENQSITDRDLDILSDHESDHEQFRGLSPAAVTPFTVTGRGGRGYLGNVGSSVAIPHGVGVAGEDEVFFAASRSQEKRPRSHHGLQSPTQVPEGPRPLERHDSNLSNYRPAPSRRSIVPTVRLTTWLQSNPEVTQCFTFRGAGYHYIGSAAARACYTATHGGALSYHAIDDEFTSMSGVLDGRCAYVRFIFNTKHSTMPCFSYMPENLVLLPCVHMLVNAYQEEDDKLLLRNWQPLTGPDCETGFGLVTFGVGDYIRIGDWVCKVSEVSFTHVTTD